MVLLGLNFDRVVAYVLQNGNIVIMLTVDCPQPVLVWATQSLHTQSSYARNPTSKPSKMLGTSDWLSASANHFLL